MEMTEWLRIASSARQCVSVVVLLKMGYHLRFGAQLPAYAGICGWTAAFILIVTLARSDLILPSPILAPLQFSVSELECKALSLIANLR